MSSGSTVRDGRASSSPDRPDHEAGRKRKQRQPLSCAECRRLKLKCDRQVPCANCVRRSCADICPDGARLPSKASHEETSDLKARLEALEGLLRGQDLAQLADTRLDSVRSDPDRADSFSAMKRVRIATDDDDHARQEPSHSTQATVPQEQTDQNAEISREYPDFSTSGRNLQVSNFVMPDTVEQRFDFDFSIPVHRDTTTSHDSQQRHAEANTSLTTDQSLQDLGHGTLVMSKSGASSRYLGHTAASEWLRDQEFHETGDNSSPRPSRLVSPERPDAVFSKPGSFPFSTSPSSSSTSVLLAGLPEEHEARVLVDSYFRYFAWHFDVAPRPTMEALINDMYSLKRASALSRSLLDPQRLALLFIILAIADEYLDLAKRSLAKSDFMTHCTIAGVQTLHVMAHYHLATEKGRNGDSAWPLWGLAMRLLQAMGLHRDGTKWNLDREVVEARRRVFWESYSADIFQANCFSRPSSIAPQYIDTALPEGSSDETSDPTLRHDLLKFELSAISAQVLDHAMRVDAPLYTSVSNLHDKLVTFERNIPYGLRCRAVLLALPSLYPDSETAIRESPELTRKDLRKTLQQFTLALNVSESLLFLHRPYFARALHERKSDPTQTEYGQSYLCVVERCNVMIQICAAIYPLHPGVISRHWFFWYHVFNAAVCMGTLILQDPRNMMASYALSLIQQAIALYSSIIQSHSTTRLVKNLEWLLKLRQRATMRMQAAASEEIGEANIASDGEEDVELIGWRTRLVQRLGKGNQTATTITPTYSAATPSPNTAMANTITQALQNHFVPDQVLHTAQAENGGNQNYDQGTDTLLHQFWDPMMLQEPTASGDPLSTVDWWNWEPNVTSDGDVNNANV